MIGQTKPWLFEPWNFGKTVRLDGRKLLLLGESHYNDGPAIPDEKAAAFTSDTIKEWSNNGSRYRRPFFANVYETVTGRDWTPGSPEVDAFWANVYFYNYIQAFVGPGAGHRPKAAMWKSAEAPFRSVLEALAPDAVLVLGNALWNNMADADERGPDLPGGIGATYWYHYGDGGRCLAGHIRHPSSPGFSSAERHPAVRQFLESSPYSTG